LKKLLPAVVGDVRADQDEQDEAIRLYLKAFDTRSATDSLLSLLKDAQAGSASARRIKALKKSAGYCLAHKRFALSTNEMASVFLRLVSSPSKECIGDNASYCMNQLGRRLVLLAVDFANVDRTILYSFSSAAFLAEIRDFLVAKYASDQTRVVRWFIAKGELYHANALAEKRVESWSSRELCVLALLLFNKENDRRWLYNKIKAKDLANACILAIVGSRKMAMDSKDAFLRLCKVGHSRPRKKGSVCSQSITDDYARLFAAAAREQNRDPFITKYKRVGDAIQEIVESWNKGNTKYILRQMQLVIQVLDMAEPRLSESSFRDEFSGVFRAIESQCEGAAGVHSCTTREEKVWLLRAFHACGVTLSVPTKHSIDILELALVANLRNQALQAYSKAPEIPERKAIDILCHALQLDLDTIALDASWKALATRDSREKSWKEVLALWMKASDETVADAILILNPFAPDVDHESLFILRNYGAGAFRYFRLRSSGKLFDDVASQNCVNELRQKLKTRFVPAYESDSGKASKNVKSRQKGATKGARLSPQNSICSSPTANSVAFTTQSTMNASAASYTPQHGLPLMQPKCGTASKKSKRKNRRNNKKKHGNEEINYLFSEGCTPK
jgi:hypothetical protein